MGLTYTELRLTNVLNKQSVNVRALVDSGATFMCVPEEVARQLGFDTQELSTQLVRTADSRQIEVGKIAPIEIAFGNRTYVTEALVMGDESLMGVLPLDAMDLVIDPNRRTITVNPSHPNYPVAYAKRS